MAFDFKFPDVGEGIHEGKIVRWLVKEGDTVTADQSLAEIETDKAIVEIPSPRSGKISKMYNKEGDVIKVGETLVTLEESASSTAPGSEEPKKESTGVVGSLEQTAVGVLKAPSLEMSGAVFGTEEKSSTTAEVSTTPAPSIASQTPSQNTSSSPLKTGTTSSTMGVVKAGLKAVKKYDLFGYVDRKPYDGVRKSVGDHMVKALSTIPQVTHMDFVDVSRLFEIREKEKVRAEKEGIKLTFMPFFLKALVAGLKKHPSLNSTLDDANDEIIYKKYYNIGLAVDTEAGLMVPVLKGADKKNILQLAKEIQELADKARTRKINPMDFKGGSCTITNIGSAGGGVFATPIINHPEAAILGVGMIKDMAGVKNGKVVAIKTLPIFVSYDHRIIDGAEAARFMVTVKEHLEDPNLLLMEE